MILTASNTFIIVNSHCNETFVKDSRQIWEQNKQDS